MGLAIAQNVKVSGIVLDESGEPVVGASVIVKNQPAIGTITSVDGQFTLDVPSASKVLTIKFIGMADQDVAVSSNVRVVMKISESALDEVIVVAYGTSKKATLTGSATTVGAKDIEKVPMASFDQILQGQAPGVQVTATSGRPGAGANITIRGAGSINAGTSPLYVIDNVQVSASDFASLNPNDIENMTVLKDASATTIYGSRGANGVVLITTKKGSKGKTRFTARAQYGITTKTQDKFEMMDAYEKLTYEKQLGTGEGVKLTDEEIAAYPINTNWVDEVFRTGYTQVYEVSMSGGSDNTRFFVSGQYYKQDGIVPGSYFERTTGRINLEHDINKYLTFGVKATGGVSKEGYVRSDRNALNPFNFVYSANPYVPAYKEDGSFNSEGFPDGLNVLEQIANNPRYDNKIKGVGSAYLQWKFLNDFTFVTSGGIDYNQIIGYQYNYPNSRLSQLLGSPYGYRNDSHTHYNTLSWTNVLTYEKTFNEVHGVKAIVGTEALKYHSQTFNGAAQGFATSRVDALTSGSTAEKPDGNMTDWSLLSYLAAGNYTYEQRYIVDLAVRRDGSSRFGTDTKYGTFWAVGLGWNITEETFMENIDFLNRLKIRGSFGQSGNNDIGNYDSQGVYSYGSYNNLSTSYPSRLPNPLLSWEKSTQFSAGFDASLLDQRLNVTFDYYSRINSDLLLDRPLSRTSGFGSRKENIGELKNHGLELGINGDVIRSNDFTLNLHANVTHNINEITKLVNEGEDIDVGWNNVLKEGYPRYAYKMVRWAGVNPANGEALYYDKDGNITAVYNGDDAVAMKDRTPDPKYYGGFGFNAKYKGIELNADFFYNYGNYIYNHVSFSTMADGAQASSKNMDKRLLTDQWLKPGDITNVPRQDKNSPQLMSTRYLEDGSYLRLRNITLAYTLPQKWVTKASLSSVRVYATGSNLLTFTGFTGLDPEIGNAPAGVGSGPAGSVLDYNYPASRTFMFGLEVGF